MSVQMTIQVSTPQGVQAINRALETYSARLRLSIERTRRQLTQFEQRYGVTTAHFLSEMAAEDLHGGDIEYVLWAGEAHLLKGLEAEYQELDNARHQLH